METIRELISNFDLKKTNIDGSRDSFDYLTIQDVYKIAGPKIEEMCLEYNMTNLSLPNISGYNSLVIYADSIIEDKIYKYAIKIHILKKNDIEIFNTIHKLVSDNNISPKIYYDYIIDLMAREFNNNGFKNDGKFEWS